MMPLPLQPLLFTYLALRLWRELEDLGTPRSPEWAPQHIRLPAEFNDRFVTLRQNHLQDAQNAKANGGSGHGRERCTTLVRDKRTGEIRMVNEHLSASGESCTPNLRPPSGTEVLGSAHTHVNLEKKEHTGRDSADPNISLGGGDVAYQLEQGFGVSIVQGGATTQFMMVRTAETPSVTAEEIAEIKSDYYLRLHSLTAETRGPDGSVDFPARMTYENATRQLAKELASKYKLAYYEGQ